MTWDSLLRKQRRERGQSEQPPRHLALRAAGLESAAYVRPRRIDGAAVVAVQKAALLVKGQWKELVRPLRGCQPQWHSPAFVADARLAPGVGFRGVDGKRLAACAAAVAFVDRHVRTSVALAVSCPGFVYT